jgi:pimeloyl-ACP methyl ester carboxylesterase
MDDAVLAPVSAVCAPDANQPVISAETDLARFEEWGWRLLGCSSALAILVAVRVQPQLPKALWSCSSLEYVIALTCDELGGVLHLLPQVHRCQQQPTLWMGPNHCQVTLLGESFGGALALALASAYPSLVEHVCVVNPGGFELGR